ncbi:MAG: DUF4230 domain-containing protein [Acidobacteria bacterium]|jgi:hypothetical protein|nr:DUF4230 domain-containing protein [Acidobacteriota bacterium]
MKRLMAALNIAALAAVLLLLYNPLAKLGLLPSLSALLRGGTHEIEETPVIVQQVKNIAQMFTQIYHDEYVYDTGIIRTPVFSQNKRLIFIAKGEVIAGFDLSGLNEGAIIRRDKSIVVKLPPARVLDVVINPSGFETFIEKGEITFEESKKFHEDARRIFEYNALRKGILKNSAEQGRQTLEKFFRLLGFETVDIIIPESR